VLFGALLLACGVLCGIVVFAGGEEELGCCSGVVVLCGVVSGVLPVVPIVPLGWADGAVSTLGFVEFPG
jgi:hypothetical protein